MWTRKRTELRVNKGPTYGGTRSRVLSVEVLELLDNFEGTLEHLNNFNFDF